MTTEDKIKQLDFLIKEWVGEHAKILECNITPLISKGENYGSEIMALELKVCYNKNPSNVKTFTAVTKMCPPNNYLQEVFDTSVTFKKEIAAYKIIFPLLTEFQNKEGIIYANKYYPDCYASRLNLHSNDDVVDDNAVILLENLKTIGFETVDRMKGFNLEQTKLFIKTLAEFHAVPVGLKILKPEVFDNHILPHLSRNTIFDTVNIEEENMDVNFVTQIVQKSEECKSFANYISEAMRSCLHNLQNPSITNGVFATISHNDLWVNNIMMKLKSNTAAIKIIDFQLIDYGSCANDLLFFLFTSVQWSVIKLNFNYLVRLYYEHFIYTLTIMKCDTTNFNFSSFQEEIDFCARHRQFYHIIVMLRHVFAIKENVKDLSEITVEDISSESLVSNECKERVLSVILFYIEKKWI